MDADLVKTIGHHIIISRKHNPEPSTVTILLERLHSGRTGRPNSAKSSASPSGRGKGRLNLQHGFTNGYEGSVATTEA